MSLQTMIYGKCLYTRNKLLICWFSGEDFEVQYFLWEVNVCLWHCIKLMKFQCVMNIRFIWYVVVAAFGLLLMRLSDDTNDADI